MKKILSLLVVFSFIIIGKLYGQVSLVISECKEGENICETQKVVKYKFQNGRLFGKEVLLTIKTNDVRFDLGGNFIYQNKFIINEWGDVFDIQNKSIILRSRGVYVNILDSKLITRVHRVDDEGFYSFDLQTKISKKLRSLKNFPDEYTYKFSPNNKLIAASNGSRFGKSSFVFYKVDSKLNLIKKKVVKGQFSASVSNIANELAKVNFVWIDNENILTQKQNGEIIKVNINGQIEPIVKIEIKDEPNSSPSFGRNENGDFYYYCNEDYLIDLKTKKIKSESVDVLPLNSRFSYKSENDSWRTFYFGGKEIGRIWSGATMSFKGYLAVMFAEEGKNLGYPDGIKVWNDTTNDWITLETNWSPRFIDWLEE